MYQRDRDEITGFMNRQLAERVVNLTQSTHYGRMYILALVRVLVYYVSSYAPRSSTRENETAYESYGQPLT